MDEGSIDNGAKHAPAAQARQVLDRTEGSRPEAAERSLAQRGLQALLSALSRADTDAAAARVARLKADRPDADADTLIGHIIARASRQTALVGAASAGVALVPGIGPLAAATLGTTTDLTATFKIQAEMALEIALVRGVALSEVQRQRLIFLVTGVSTGSNVLLNRAGRQLTVHLGRRWTVRSAVKALPLIGLAASSATNVLATQLIGKRADAYFTGGTVPGWRDGLRSLSGVDERKLGAWIAESGRRLAPGRRRSTRKRRLAERTRQVVGRGRPPAEGFESP